MVFVLAGVALWFGPWRATAHAEGGVDVAVVCRAAPVDLYLYGSHPFDDGGPEAPISSDACRTSAWWRTVLGTVLLGVGIGSGTRERTAARVARMHAARA